MFVKVIFHGILKKICPDEYTVDANTPAEAIRGVTNQFKEKLIRKDGHRFICMVKECPKQIQLTSGLRTEELNIYPAFCASGGGSNNSWVSVAIGAILVTAAVLLGPAGWAAAGVGFGVVSASTATTLALMGGGMMLSGFAGIFFAPKVDTAISSDNPESSKTFGNNGNTTKIGTRIPIGYGLYKIAGQYLSVNTQAVDRGHSINSGYIGS